MPLIEDLGSKGQAKPSVVYGYLPSNSMVGFAPTNRKRTQYQADSSTKTRAINRRIAELERENFIETRIDTPKLDLVPEAVQTKKSSQRVGNTVNSRRILASKKSLSNHLDDDPTNATVYENGKVEGSDYPVQKLCTICGYWGKVTCIRCGARYCDMVCEATHRETRCLKVYG